MMLLKNGTIETIIYGICPNTIYHKEGDEESYFVYKRKGSEIPIYECGRCRKELSLISILKKNKYVIRTNENLNGEFKK